MFFLDLQNFIISLSIVIFAYFSWRKIEYGIYGIVFLLPIYLLRTEIFGIPTTVLELLIYILFVSWMIRNFRNIDLRKITSDKLLLSGICLLMAGAAISTLASIDLRTSAGILKGWFFDPLLFYVVLIFTLKDSRQAINILKVFSLSGFTVAVAALLYWLGLFSNGVSYDGRLHGFYSSPNYLSMYLAAPFIVAIWFFLRSTFTAGNNELLDLKARTSIPGLSIKNEKYFWLLSIITMLSAIYLTYSYAAWLAISASTLLLICLALPSGKKKALFIPALIAIVIVFFSQSGTGKFENLVSLSYRSSANSRVMIWRSALVIGQDHPFIGIGPGNFQRYYLEYQKKFSEPYLEWAVPEPHNVFLAFWLGAGMLGLAGFVLILVWFFRSGVLILKERRMGGDRDVAIVLLSVFVYVLLHGFFDTTYWKNDLATIFWLFLGLMAAIRK